MQNGAPAPTDIEADAEERRGFLHAQVVTDDFDDQDYIAYFSLSYTSTDGAVKVSFTVDPSTTRPSDWARLLDDMRRGANSALYTCQSNGEVSISHRDGNVLFVTNKSGAGGDGEINVTLPALACLEAIEKCAMGYADHVASGRD